MERAGQSRLRRTSLLLSVGLHLLGLWIINNVASSFTEEQIFNVSFQYQPLLPEHLKPRGSFPTPFEPTGAMEMGTVSGSYGPDFGAGMEIGGIGEGPLPMGKEDQMSLMGGKGEWHDSIDTLDISELTGKHSITPQVEDLSAGLPIARDLVELDAERRWRTVTFFDSDTKKLKKAYLHIPCRRNNPFIPIPDHRGRELSDALAFMKNGFALPSKAPIVPEIRFFRWRYRLAFDEIKEYPILLLRHIDIDLTSTLAKYLMAGGFVVVEFNSTLLELQKELQMKFKAQAKMVTLELGHPVFHAFFDISRYYPPNPLCPGIGPLPALELDGRIIALPGIPFVTNHHCPSNMLYVNILAFGLTQPSPMGGRYSIKKEE